MNPTPEALRIAEAIESGYGTEIRRLHEINGELLDACKALLAITDSVNLHGTATGDARAAIAKAEGEKA